MMLRTLATVALLTVLAGCGSEQAEGPLAGGSDPTPSASPSPSPSAAAALPAFTMPGRGDPMRLTEPRAMAESRTGAIEFATYYESITSEGLAPPVQQLIDDASAASCVPCRSQIGFVRRFNADKLTMVPKKPATFHGVVDAFKDKQGWHVTLEYALNGARSVDTSGKTVDRYDPAKFVQSVLSFKPEAGGWAVTSTSLKYLDASMTGPTP